LITHYKKNSDIFKDQKFVLSKNLIDLNLEVP
jgi:hypothetical protein